MKRLIAKLRYRLLRRRFFRLSNKANRIYSKLEKLKDAKEGIKIKYEQAVKDNRLNSLQRAAARTGGQK